MEAAMTLTSRPERAMESRDGQPRRNLHDLLEVLADRAARPLEEARRSRRILQRRGAVRTGGRPHLAVVVNPRRRVEELANPGDYIKKEIAGEPIVVTRGRDGEIRALSRVCRHRFKAGHRRGTPLVRERIPSSGA
jgi:hypothetical protein